MRWAVLGPGGVGGFLAAALARSGESVTVVAREETATHIDAHGIRVQSVLHGDYHARLHAFSRLEEPMDALIVATKAGALQAALERISPEAVRDAAIVPLLNGVEHLGVLRERFGPRVVASTIRIEVDRPEPGRVVQTSRFLRVDMASDHGVDRSRLEDLSGALERAEVPVRLGDHEAEVMWSKLTRLCALAVTTSAARRPLGEIRSSSRWRARLDSVITETAAVARAEGAAIDPDEVFAELAEAHPSLSSSMLRDIEAGRPPELDAIPGAVIRAGERHGIECPMIERLRAAIDERLAGEASGR